VAFKESGERGLPESKKGEEEAEKPRGGGGVKVGKGISMVSPLVFAKGGTQLSRRKSGETR